MVTKKSPFEKKNAFFLPMAKENHIIDLHSHSMQLEKERLVETFKPVTRGSWKHMIT